MKVSTSWMPLKDAPRHECLILATDTYDCGWCIDRGFKDRETGELYIYGAPNTSPRKHNSKTDFKYQYAMLEKDLLKVLPDDD